MKKTSRTFKRFAAITSASLLAACMVAPMSMNITASAVSITIKDAEVNSKYAGYKLLSAEQDGTTITYDVPDKYLAILQSVTGKSTKADIIAHIGAIEDDSTAAREFADAVYMKILAATPAITPEATTTGETAMDAEQGYYLIAETQTGTTGDTVSDDSFSLVILNTAGASGLEVTTKEGEPTLVKKLKDTNDSTGEITNWQDGADYDIGDDIPFQLTGTVSSKYDNYKEYYYSFHDTLSTGLTFNNDVRVLVDGNEITSGYEVVTEGLTDGCSFEVRFADLKVINGVTASSNIVVEYTAKLNNDAVLGSTGNPNVADLEYSTNPYFSDENGDGKDDTTGGKEDTGYTPKDKVIVFTYKTVVNKVDQSNNPLKGAQFELYKKLKDGTEIKLSTVDVINDDTTTFEFKGLDDGNYRLHESKHPENYNPIDDIEFTISATHDVTSDNPALTELTGGDKFTGNVNAGTLTADIVNKYGSELPSTGGIGTTIFYLGGGAMVAVAGIYLISKKRMKNTQE